jgi:endonuclease/exonuclease/phosphatase family metal-dependent hydrolase
MKIGAFNVENLFNRAKAFNENQATASTLIKGVAELNELFEKDLYSDADKARMIELIKELGLSKSDTSKFVILRKTKGKIIHRPRNSPNISISAKGRKDWIGWAELRTEPVDEIAMHNTGRVMRDLNADILAVIEAENRITLQTFSDIVIRKVNGQPYEKIMLIDGNDERGIDVGIMAQSGYQIDLVKTHIFDTNSEGNKVFSRDLPEYKIITPSGEIVWILPAHFKSKFGGNDPRSQKKRKGEAEKAKEVYTRLRNEGYENIIVCGDFNDTPDSEALSPLLTNTDLKDFSNHNTFVINDNGGVGTYGNGSDKNKIDYILLSPNLFDKIIACGIFRKGAWAGKQRPKWEMYPELTEEIHAASDHHAVWCEINI